MGKSIKGLLAASVLLTLGDCTVSYFGVEYEINKIPPAKRALMSDFDWVGFEWIMLGMLLQAIAFLLVFIALYRWFRQRRNKQFRRIADVY